MSESLNDLLLNTRRMSLAFCEPLQHDDYGLQAEAFTSPPKWHLAHTTWFFETFLLKPYLGDYQSPDPLYEVLFNSYYNGVGNQYPRPRRGLLSRPTVNEVMLYREQVDSAMTTLLSDTAHPDRDEILTRTKLGIEHERQHQELFFTDLKYSFALNPLFPRYSAEDLAIETHQQPMHFSRFEGGLQAIGFDGDGFCFDNELPRHPSYIAPFELANRLVTNQEYQAFIDDGGYQRPELWLADGWDALKAGGWQSPHHWVERDGEHWEFTLHGLQSLSPADPVCHVSAYEADAYARWCEARLPTEEEWELAASGEKPPDRGVESGRYHPRAAPRETGLLQLYGDCWQWTQSAYSPYPGYRPSAGVIGEYNGKFMSNQWVLRGGSCVTGATHTRSSYRNFFYPDHRWQFSGIRLARDAGTP